MNNLICPKCKSEIEDGSNFCEVCGNPLNAVCENVADAELEELMLELEKAKIENVESIADEIKAKQRYESVSDIPVEKQYKMPCEKSEYCKYNDYIPENQDYNKGKQKKKKQNVLIPVVIVLASVTIIAVLICILFAFGVFDPFVNKEGISEKSEISSSEDPVVINETWAEDYYSSTVSKLKFSNYASVAFDTGAIVGLFNSNGSDIVNDMIILNNIVSAYDSIIGSEDDSYIEYYDADSLFEEESLNEEEKSLFNSFFDVGTYVKKYSADKVQKAFDFFYGKDTFKVQDLSNDINLKISESGEDFYVQAGGIGLQVSSMFYKLKEVEYYKDEAVLVLNILSSPDDSYLYDYVTGFEITQNNQVDTYEVDNETAFDNLCKENNIDAETLGTVRIKVFHDSTGVHIKVS